MSSAELAWGAIKFFKIKLAAKKMDIGPDKTKVVKKTEMGPGLRDWMTPVLRSFNYWGILIPDDSWKKNQILSKTDRTTRGESMDSPLGVRSILDRICCRMISRKWGVREWRRFDLIKLPYLLTYSDRLGKQFRPRSDAAKHGIWSGSTLFATHPTILHTFTGSKMDLFKRRIR